MPKFTKAFTGVRAGDIYPTEFKPGDECPDELVEAAKSLGAIGVGAATKSKGAAPENKKRKS